MVKEYNINTTYNGKQHMFQCEPSEFMANVARFYNLDESSIILYAIKKDSKIPITPTELTDIMSVEVVTRTAENRQRSIRSYMDEENSKQKSFLDKIVTNLKENHVLTGLERQYLVDMITSQSDDTNKKRKYDGANGPSPKVSTIHKKVQVRPSRSNQSTQTEHITLPDEQRSQDHSDINDRLKRLAGSERLDIDEVKQIMDTTFDDRRIFIQVKNPPVITVKDKYPLLFSLEEVKNEIDRLFFKGKCDEFLSKIDQYAKVILNELDESNMVYVRTIKNLERCRTQEQKKYVRAVGSILAIPELLREEPTFIKKENNASHSDMYEVYPYIEATSITDNEFFFNNSMFQIITENILLCESTNFKEAILCIMAGFFIFNISYPKSCEQTLIIFEKLYLNANDTEKYADNTAQFLKLFRLKALKMQNKNH